MQIWKQSTVCVCVWSTVVWTRAHCHYALVSFHWNYCIGVKIKLSMFMEALKLDSWSCLGCRCVDDYRSLWWRSVFFSVFAQLREYQLREYLWVYVDKNHITSLLASKNAFEESHQTSFPLFELRVGQLSEVTGWFKLIIQHRLYPQHTHTHTHTRTPNPLEHWSKSKLVG